MTTSKLRYPRLIGIVLSVCGALVALYYQPAGKPPTAAGQAQEADSTTQIYSLKNASPADVAPQVERVLSALPGQAEVSVDTAQQRIIVKGSGQAQELARRMIDSLDRPAAAKSPNDPIVKAYPSPGNAADVAARLQAAYPAESGVRIAADARTEQIVVLAPPNVQDEIARRLQGDAGPALSGAPAPSSQQQNAKSTVETQRVVKLQNLRPEDFEAALQQLWGRALPVTTQPTQDRASYAFDASGGLRLRLDVDRRGGQVIIHGPEYLVESWAHVVQAIDSPPATADQSTKVVSYQKSDPNSIRKALGALLQGGAAAINGGQGGRDALVTMLFQPRKAGDQLAQAPAGTPPAAQPAPAGQADDEGVGGLSGPVQIEFLEGLDIVVVRGRPRDVQRVTQIIQDIERLSAETAPTIEIYPLKNIASDQAATFVRTIYDQSLAARQGTVTITSLGKPNSLLLIGRAESVKSVIDLIQRLDVPVPANAQFKVFPLQHTSVSTAQTTVQEFFARRTGLGGAPQVTADLRSNSLLAQGSPRDLEELDLLLKTIDVETSAAVNELRVFPLRNSLAEDLAPILQDAIANQSSAPARRGVQQQQQQQPQGGGGAGGGGGGGGQPQQAQPQQQQQGAQTQQQQTRSAMLRFMTIDAQGVQQFRSGILSDVKITADPRANALLISAPAESMELLTALVRQLDQIPASESQIKVYEIKNGDASNLATMLEGLFGITSTRPTGTGGAGPAAAVLQALGAASDGSLVQLRFTVDQRTNSIIASGSRSDLSVVEAILLRLDESDVRQRKNAVYRLRNAPAADVSATLNQFLRSQIQVQQIQPGLLSPFEQIEREVIVVPEPVTNSLIISATPRYYEEMVRLVKELDERPPMVMIQVLIAEVALNNTDEFGIELGLQNSVLFDRSLLGDLVTTNTTTTLLNGSTLESQTIVGASNTPGFAFNTPGAPLGNSGSDKALAGSGNVGKQALTNFGVGRINNQLGFGGLVLSASSENVSALLRALRECRRMDVLSRPQVMALDNQPAFIQVGQRVPRITNVQFTATGQINNTTLDNVGLIMQVQPRISPDGLVVMQIHAERSDVAPEAEGIPISISVTGEVIRSPRINVITAQTTVSALSGQTVVLGGLITKNQSDIHRRVPVLSNIPILGNLFRYDSVAQTRTELLIILTPRIVRSEDDMEEIKQVEASRMSWCLADVTRIHGESGLRGRCAEWGDLETTVIYPDNNPTGKQNMPTLAEPIPAGSPTPAAPRTPTPASGQTPPPSGGQTMPAMPPVPPLMDGASHTGPAINVQAVAGPRDPVPPPQTEVRFGPVTTGVAPAQNTMPAMNQPEQNSPTRPATPVVEPAGGPIPPGGGVVPAQFQWPVQSRPMPSG